MKKTLLLLAGISISLISCSPDDNSNTTDTDQMTLSKMIYYEPAAANFTTKRIFYYGSDHKIIADTTFDNTGNWTERSERIYTATMNTSNQYDANGNLLVSNYTVYDTQGRIIKTKIYNAVCTYVYNNEGTVAEYQLYGSESVNKWTFYKNDDGIIYKRIDMVQPNEITLDLENQKPINYRYDGLIAGSFTYYPNPMPENMVQSVLDMNNTILNNNRLEHLPSKCNSYLKNWFGINNYHKEFNALNYLTADKVFHIEENGSETPSYEMYYYYNED